jgi:phospholipid/cholesterol/gamma-HCH transport system ATP-binding protein
MTSAIFELEAVVSRSFNGLSCRAEPGEVLRFSCAVQEERDELWSVMTGATAPRKGSVRIAQQNLYLMDERAQLALFQRIGSVAHDGGLISNLKGWENLVLPAWYHRGTAAADIEARAVPIFRELGLDNEMLRGVMRRLPDRLSTVERRCVAIVRAMLMEPDIMIYDAPFTGVERDAAARMLRVLLQFHRARAGRVSIFLLPDEPFSDRVAADVTIALGS